MKDALLIIDVQQGLCSGRWAMFEAAAMIERINAASARARAAGVPVWLVQHEEPEGLRHGSDAWQLDSRLQTAATDHRLRKTASDAFHQTALDAQLHEAGVARLVVCGLQTDYCVDTTVRRALGLGWPVVLLADAHSTMDNGVLSAQQIIDHHNLTLSRLDSFGPRVSSVASADMRFEVA